MKTPTKEQIEKLDEELANALSLHRRIGDIIWEKIRKTERI